ncbi:hypothetical protein [Glycomyces xiaoerkulensis]|uniref:hypothetical protein n=1 Tax=Glycomyces xiaoerkulensis TaxID=2038139 RepID=UPI000C258176|nr:hypothetical protein [Glycomyces xiaoerkulensis]
MSEQSASGEIRLEIEGDPDPAPAPRSRFALPRVPNSALTLASVFLLAAATVVIVLKWYPWGPTPAEEAVAEFLNAARDGEVERALGLAGTDPEGESLLDPAALDGRWEIGEITQVAFRDDDGGRAAEVYAEIESGAGQRVGERFTVSLDGPEPVVTDGVVGLEVLGNDSGATVNGVAVGRPGWETVVKLLPGVYELRATPMWPFEAEPETVLVLGEQAAHESVRQQIDGLNTPRPTMSDGGWEAIDAEVRDFLDSCLEAPGDGCPFELPDDPRITDPGRWEIASYPSATADPLFYMPRGVELTTRVPGEARIEATVADDSPAAVTLACDLRVEGIVAAFDEDGEAEFDWGQAPACGPAVVID